MSLFVVATPIGNQADLSPRALQTLKDCEVIIGEEFREASTLLKHHGVSGKKLEQLNEHSTREDLLALVEICQHHSVALISDCGTPGFCDPGAELVALCRAQGIQIASVPGVSSLTTFLSLCGQRLDEFYFKGFLPANRENRTQTLKKLKADPRAVILMDTPYRLSRLLQELATLMPDRLATIGLDLTSENEMVLTNSLTLLSQTLRDKKAEFLLLLHEQNQREASLSRKKSR